MVCVWSGLEGDFLDKVTIYNVCAAGWLQESVDYGAKRRV